MAKGNGGLVLLVLAGVGAAAYALSSKASTASASPGSGGINPGGVLRPGLGGLLGGSSTPNVDFTGINAFYQQQMQQLQAAFTAAGGTGTLSANLIEAQRQVAAQQAAQQQASTYASIAAQAAAAQAGQFGQLSTWQQQASSSISKAGVDTVTAQQIASQLDDAQARYIDWLIRVGGYSYDDARMPTVSGKQDLDLGQQIETAMGPNQKKALSWLFQDAWTPTTGTPSISASWPPTPAVVRRLAQLASALSDSDAQYMVTKIGAGTGIRAAYEQVISANGKIQVQPDGSVTSG